MSSAEGAPSGREPLLLIHGLGGTRTVWEPVIPLLEGEREVHAIDMPGFGSAPPLPPEVEPTAANLARAVHEECARNGVERPHVAGNSLGGWVGREMGRCGWAASTAPRARPTRPRSPGSGPTVPGPSLRPATGT